MRQKRGVWIGVYFMADILVIGAYLLSVALVSATGIDRPQSNPVWVGMFFIYNPCIALYFILLWHDVVIWLNEPKRKKGKVKKALAVDEK